MRCPRCFSETPPAAFNCPGCQLPTPKAADRKNKKKAKAAIATKSPAARKPKKEGREVSRGVAVAVMVCTVALCSLGGYYGMEFYDRMTAPPPDPAEMALQKVRKLPSSTDGMSIEDYLIAEVAKSREAGRLHEMEGWMIEPIRDMTFLVVFSYEEKDRHQRAAWEVDLKHNTCKPQTELAAAALKQ